jgi:hypothetical protein
MFKFVKKLFFNVLKQKLPICPPTPMLDDPPTFLWVSSRFPVTTDLPSGKKKKLVQQQNI